MAEHDDILRKIKACLAMAQSDNPNEAATALQRARDLMEKYDVSIDDVAISDVTSCYSSAKGGRVPPAHIGMLAGMVARVFGVEFVYRVGFDGSRWCGGFDFFGIGAGPEMAAYAYEVLERQLIKGRTAYIRTLNKRLKRQTKVRRGDMYAQGWVSAVADKITPHKRTDKETRVIAEYQEKRWPGQLAQCTPRNTAGKARVHDYGAVAQGLRDGREVQFHQGVSGSEQARIAGRRS